MDHMFVELVKKIDGQVERTSNDIKNTQHLLHGFLNLLIVVAN